MKVLLISSLLLVSFTLLGEERAYLLCSKMEYHSDRDLPNTVCFKKMGEDSLQVDLYNNKELLDSLNGHIDSPWEGVIFHGRYLWSYAKLNLSNSRYVLDSSLNTVFNKIGKGGEYILSNLSAHELSVLNRNSQKFITKMKRTSSRRTSRNPRRRCYVHRGIPNC